MSKKAGIVLAPESKQDGLQKEESHAVQEEGQEIDRLQSEKESDEEEEIAEVDNEEPGRNVS